MALNRRSGQRFHATIWPGFVDALSALLLVMIFLLTMFVVVQSVQNDTITGQESELNRLSTEVDSLAQALGTEQQSNFTLEQQVDKLGGDLAAAENNAKFQATLIENLTAQVVSRNAALTQSEAKADAAEAARLAAAENAQNLAGRLKLTGDELTAMTLSLEAKRKEAEDTLTLLAAARTARDDLDARLMAALLEGTQGKQDLAQAEVALEQARKDLAARGAQEATLRDQLAAAVLAKQAAEAGSETVRTEAERQKSLLATAQTELSQVEAASADDQRKLALLNEQVGAMRGQLSQLQALLDSAKAQDADAGVQIEALGAKLNVALARVAAEQKRRAELEAAERARLEDETKQLANYRSEFFGRLREVLGEREGVQVVGDRFVFSSEVLFASGSADLSLEGRFEIAKVASLLQEVAAVIPPGINWMIRVDGHTDDIPLTGGGRFRDNWELSQARALSVVRFMVESFGFPPDRLAAAGFAEFQPLDPAKTEAARAKNRRIELKLTER